MDPFEDSFTIIKPPQYSINSNLSCFEHRPDIMDSSLSRSTSTSNHNQTENPGVQESSLSLVNPMRAISEKIEKIVKSPPNEIVVNEDFEWRYLENDGTLIKYEDLHQILIEEVFTSNYDELSRPDYEKYSIEIEINVRGCSYKVQFSNSGSIHRQIRKNASLDTVRLVKRYIKGEKIPEVRRDYIWKWRHQSGEYREYEPDINFLIENCYRDYKKNNLKAIVLISGSNDNTYQIDFNNMKQLNEITSIEKLIRREDLSSPDIIDYEWRWQDNQIFKKYNINIMKSIEKAYQIFISDRSQNTFQFKGENCYSYRIYFESMSQINIKTKVSRKIIRNQSNEESKSQ